MKNLQSFMNTIALNRTKHRQNIMITTVLSVLVMFIVSLLLTKPADSMTGTLICDTKPHQHTESCYAFECDYQSEQFTETLTDETIEAVTEHEHTFSCYKLVCQMSEHEHSNGCYSEEILETTETEIEIETETDTSTETSNSETSESEITQAETTETTPISEEENINFFSTYYNSINLMADESANEWFTTPLTTLPQNGTVMDITQYLVDGEQNLTGIQNTNISNNLERTDTFKLSFEIDGSLLKNLSAKPLYFTYKLPEGLTFTVSQADNTCTIMDGSKLSSYYSKANIENEQSLLVFRVVEKYYNEEINISDTTTKYKCTLEFQGITSRAETDDGDRTLDFGNGIVDVVEFSNYTPTMSKGGAIEVDSTTNDMYIKWTVSLTDRTYDRDFTGYQFTDDMFANAIEGSIEIQPDTSYFDVKTKTILKDLQKDETLKIIYKTKVSDEDKNNTSGTTITNKAYFSKDGDSLKAEKSVGISPPVTIGKTGKYDYLAKTGVEKKIDWSVSVYCEYSTSLNGYQVVDEAFKSLTADDITITYQPTWDTTAEITDFNLDPITGTLTFGDVPDISQAHMKTLYINYKTDVTFKEGSDKETIATKNIAQLYYPNGDKYPLDAQSTVSGNYEPYQMSKSGRYNPDHEYVEWTIDFNSTNESFPINGMSVTDDAFIGMLASDFTITAKTSNHQDTSNFSWELDSTTGTIKFKTDDTQQNQAVRAKIVYIEAPTDEEKAVIESKQTVTFKNEATLSNDSGYELTVKKEFTFDPRREITKTLNTKDKPVFKVNDENKISELSWTIKMVQDVGFSGGDKSLVDVMEDYDYTTKADTLAEHYMSAKQQKSENIIVKAKTTNDDTSTFDTLTLGTDYNINFFYADNSNSTEKAIKFEVVFLKTVDAKNYKCVEINYNTTADMTNVTTPLKVAFNNTASFDGKEHTPNSPFIAETYNTDEQPYQKAALDKEGNEITKDTDYLYNVEKKTLSDGIEYYIFKWKIDLTLESNAASITLIDTFDEGFTLCTDTDYAPKRTNADGSVYSVERKQYEVWCGNYDYFYVDGSNSVKFCGFPDWIKKIEYATKISVSTFDAKYSEDITILPVGNTVIDSNNTYDPLTVSVNYSNAEKEPDKITKEYVPNANVNVSNYVDYTIDINPLEEDLANGNQLILKDNFATKSFTSSGTTTYGALLADAVLESFSIYKVNEDGSLSNLSTSDYTYRFTDETTDKTTLNPTKVKDNVNEYVFGTTNKWGSVGELLPGDILTFTIKSGVANLKTFDSSQISCFFRGGGQETVIRPVLYAPIQFDENGDYTFTVIVPEKAYHVSVWTKLDEGETGCYLQDIELVAQRKTSTSEFQLIVPDSTHLKLVYQYKVLQNGTRPVNGTTLTMDNTATLIGDNTYTSSADDVALTFNYSSGSASIDSFPTIKKRDVADYSIVGLDASFRFGYYDATAKNWKWCNQELVGAGAEITEMATLGWSTVKDEAKIITTEDGEFQLNGLESKVIYVLEETAVMTDTSKNSFTYESVDKVEPFYFVYNTSPETYPLGINSESLSAENVINIQQNGEINVPNNRIIDVTVNKEWGEQQTNAEVEVELYWSYTKLVKGFPNDLVLAEKGTETNQLDIDTEFSNPISFTASYTWSGLPNGINNKPIYYYVKEKSYTVDGVKYTVDDTGNYVDTNGNSLGFKPVYTGNAINRTIEQIQIFNASSLRVEKKWVDSYNRELPLNEIPESIQFKLYGKETADSVEVEIGTFEITAENDWIYKFDISQIEDYLFFRVEELNPLEDFNVNYSSNYAGTVGKFIITNKSTKDPKTLITVEKMWNDGGATNRLEPTFTVQQSIDNATWTNVADVVTPTPIKSGNKWVYTFDQLPYRDSNGNIYSYKVIEADMNEYTASYQNNDGIESGVIVITNTKTLDLSINKVWKDSYKNGHENLTIEVFLHRSITPSDAKSDTTAEPIDNVKISKSDNWTHVFDKLPMYDESGQPYYYWIVERQMSAYNTSYTYPNANENYITVSDGTVVINNNYIYDPVELPVTGGEGTKIFYTIGLAFVVTATVYIILRKRITKK